MDDLIRAERLRSQLLSAKATSVSAVASHFGALQGQDLPAVLWALGLRSGAASVEQVRQAFDSGEVVRGWPMRGTLHAVPANDLGWVLSLTSQRIIARAASRRVELELDDALVERAQTLCVKLLEGGRGATRAEFLEHLEQAGISTKGQRGYHLIWMLSHQGLICWGPFRGAEQELRLMSEWIPQPLMLERDVSLARFAELYVRGHAPATEADFAGWSGMTLKDCRRGLALAVEGGQVRPWDLDGQYYVAAGGNPAPKATGLISLTGFDEYYLGYRSRDAVIDPTHAGHVVPGNNGIFKPILLQEGRAVATWKRTASAKGLAITVVPFVGGAAPRSEQLEALFEPFAAFWQTTVRSVSVER